MNKIVEIAQSYLGQREITGNKGFIDKVFEKKMRGVGFYTGAAWCLFFARLVWKESGQSLTYTDKNGKEHDLITPSALGTMRAADAADNWHVEPVVGAIAIFRMFKGGNPLQTGHGCVVTSVGDGIYSTTDGNTTDKGGRDGVLVAIRNRHLNAESWTKDDGLRLMGFVYPKI